jgi:hypothetical protein
MKLKCVSTVKLSLATSVEHNEENHGQNTNPEDRDRNECDGATLHFSVFLRKHACIIRYVKILLLFARFSWAGRS